jgi:hypothetical protein
MTRDRVLQVTLSPREPATPHESLIIIAAFPFLTITFHASHLKSHLFEAYSTWVLINPHPRSPHRTVRSSSAADSPKFPRPSMSDAP